MLRDATFYERLIRESDYPEDPPPPEQGALWPVYLHAIAGQPPLPVPKSPTTSGTLPAYVNHGAWVVKCPCGSAQFACREDHRFFCTDCSNVGFKGAWAAVEWPDDAGEIEAVLLERLYPINQNWAPGETVEDLRGEVPGPADELNAPRVLREVEA